MNSTNLYCFKLNINFFHLFNYFKNTKYKTKTRHIDESTAHKQFVIASVLNKTQHTNDAVCDFVYTESMNC